MLALFDFTIVFNPSRDFSRCITFAHLSAGALLLQSCVQPLFLVIGILLLLISHQHTRQLRSPYPNYNKLVRCAQFWLLECDQGHSERYDAMHICFDGGFFLLLRLTNETHKKNLVLFNDQITQDQHRQLKVLSRIT